MPLLRCTDTDDLWANDTEHDSITLEIGCGTLLAGSEAVYCMPLSQEVCVLAHSAARA